MEFSNNQFKAFSDIWKELLKEKVNIIFKIANEKKVDFHKLLEEFIPEAFENRDIWEKNYPNISGSKKTTKLVIGGSKKTKTKTKKLVIGGSKKTKTKKLVIGGSKKTKTKTKKLVIGGSKKTKTKKLVIDSSKKQKS